MFDDDFLGMMRAMLAHLCAPFWHRCFPSYWMERRTLIHKIGSALGEGPTPALAAMAVRASRDLDLLIADVEIDDGERLISHGAAGIWIRAWRLLRWEDLIDTHLPAAISQAYHPALAAMNPQMRQIFLLHRVGELDFPEIAAFLRSDVKTVQSLLGQSLAILCRHVV